MKTTFVAAVAVIVTLTAPALAPDQAPPPERKANVQKLVDAIRATRRSWRSSARS